MAAQFEEPNKLSASKLRIIPAAEMEKPGRHLATRLLSTSANGSNEGSIMRPCCQSQAAMVNKTLPGLWQCWGLLPPFGPFGCTRCAPSQRYCPGGYSSGVQHFGSLAVPICRNVRLTGSGPPFDPWRLHAVRPERIWNRARRDSSGARYFFGQRRTPDLPGGSFSCVADGIKLPEKEPDRRRPGPS
jgi:hypothetical protein